jgi:hypothetical protein
LLLKVWSPGHIDTTWVLDLLMGDRHFQALVLFLGWHPELYSHVLSMQREPTSGWWKSGFDPALHLLLCDLE